MIEDYSWKKKLEESIVVGCVNDVNRNQKYFVLLFKKVFVYNILLYIYCAGSYVDDPDMKKKRISLGPRRAGRKDFKKSWELMKLQKKQIFCNKKWLQLFTLLYIYIDILVLNIINYSFISFKTLIN